ncbi:MAG: diacylglycerol kinase [Epsilonproteobacteria bacterium]|nr:diacylglycerol kinase [Campylobacterota bacterium]
MNNKPKYSIFKNAKYALDGLVHAIRTESSFKIELFFAVLFFPIIYILPFELMYKLVLIVTFMMILIVELLNSAIENVVDLVTQERHPLAKSAKDIAATAVFFTVLLHLLCWIVIGFKLI